MKTTIDRAGRIVIPKELREAAGLAPGAEIEVRLQDGRIEVELADVGSRLRRRGRFLVAEPTQPVAPLTNATVSDVLDDARARGGSKRGR